MSTELDVAIARNLVCVPDAWFEANRWEWSQGHPFDELALLQRPPACRAVESAPAASRT